MEEICIIFFVTLQMQIPRRGCARATPSFRAPDGSFWLGTLGAQKAAHVLGEQTTIRSFLL